MTAILKSYEEQDRYFVETNAYKMALDQVMKMKHIVITGRPGEGKTGLAIHMVNHLVRNGYTFHWIKKPDKFPSIDFTTPNIVLADDIFGSSIENRENTRLWVNEFEFIYRVIIGSDSLFVMTSRTEMVKYVRSGHWTLQILQPEGIFDLNDKDKRQTEKEKSAIFDSLMRYAMEKGKPLPDITSDARDEICTIPDLPIGFPQCAKMFIFEKEYHSKGTQFFQNPTDMLLDQMKKLVADDDAKSILLTLLYLQGDNPEIRIDKEDSYRRVFAENGLEKLADKTNESEMIRAANELEGDILIRTSKTTFRFSHECFHESASILIGQENPNLALNVSRLDYLTRIVDISHEDQPDTARRLALKTIEQKKTLARRLISEIRDGKARYVSQYPHLNNKTFIEAFAECIAMADEDENISFGELMSIEDKTNQGTFFFWCATENHCEFCNGLLSILKAEQTIDENQRKSLLSTMLLGFCGKSETRNIALIKTLLQEGASPSWCETCENGKTTLSPHSLKHLSPIENASQFSNDALVQFLLQNKGISPHFPCKEEFWALIHAFADFGDTLVCSSAFIKALTDFYKNHKSNIMHDLPTASNKDKFIKLISQCKEETDVNKFYLIFAKHIPITPEIANGFQSQNVDFQTLDSKNETAVIKILQSGLPDDNMSLSLDTVIQRGCCPNKRKPKGTSPIHLCLRLKKRYKSLEVLAKAVQDINQPDDLKNTPLITCISDNNKEDNETMHLTKIISQHGTLLSEHLELPCRTAIQCLKMKTFEVLVKKLIRDPKYVNHLMEWCFTSKIYDADKIKALEILLENGVHRTHVYNDETMISILLKKSPISEDIIDFALMDGIDLEQVYSGETILTLGMKAIRKDHLSCSFIDKIKPKTILNVVNSEGQTPLMIASNNFKGTKTILTLLRIGADIHLTDKKERNVAHHLFSTELDDDQTVNILEMIAKYKEREYIQCMLGSRDDNLHTPIMVLFKNQLKRPKSVSFVLDISMETMMTRGPDDRNVLHFCVESPLEDSETLHFANVLIDKGSIDPNETDKNGISPLHILIAHSIPKQRTLILMISRFVTKSRERASNFKVVQEMAEKCKLGHALIDPLIEAGILSKTSRVFHLLGGVCDEIPELDLLCEKLCHHKFDINQKDPNGNTPLHIACREKASPLTIENFLIRSADPTAKNSDDETPLHLAISSERTDDETQIVAKLLIQYKCNVNEVDENEQNALMTALTSRRPKLQTIHFLIQNDADENRADDQGQSSIHKCITSSLFDYDAYRVLRQFKQPDVKRKDNSGYTPLNLLARFHGQSRILCLIWLLDNAGGVRTKDKRGRSPLYNVIEALSVSREQLLQLECSVRILILMRYGSPLEQATPQNETPLQLLKKKNIIALEKVFSDKNPHESIESLEQNIVESFTKVNVPHTHQQTNKTVPNLEETKIPPEFRPTLESCILVLWGQSLDTKESPSADASDFLIPSSSDEE